MPGDRPDGAAAVGLNARSPAIQPSIQPSIPSSIPSSETPSVRHLITLGAVPPALLDDIAHAWRPDRVNGPLESDHSVLLLYDAAHPRPRDFIEHLAAAAAKGCPVGVWPAYDEPPARTALASVLSPSHLALDLSACRLRLSTSPQARNPDLPWQLRRSGTGPDMLADDLHHAGLLFLQGHAGPLDGAFGRGLTLCGRDLHRPGHAPLFPCVESGRCFRQPPQGRDELSREGLISPQDVLAPLVVLDGCGTFPMPGALFPYEQSLLRGLVQGLMRREREGAVVLSLGISATPMSAIVLFMALMAEGLPLGRVVREVNLHREGCGSPSSCPGDGVGPWVLVGNPELRIRGLSLYRPAVNEIGAGTQQAWIPGDEVGDGGVLLALPPGDAVPLDLACRPPRWAHGAVDRAGRRFAWLGPCPDTEVGQAAQVPPSSRARDDGTLLRIVQRTVPSSAQWRDTARWLQEGNRWLEGLKAFVESRVDDIAPLADLVAVRTTLAQSAEGAACAVTERALEITPDLASASAPLIHAINQTDHTTAAVVAHFATWTGARLSHLWSPPWHHTGTRLLGRRCDCGCDIAVHERRHPLLDLQRAELSCPSCSLLGDVAMDAAGVPLLHARLENRTPASGGPLRWDLMAVAATAPWTTTACASLFDPYRQRRLVGRPQALRAGTEPSLVQMLPADWPTGMAWATLVTMSGGRVSMFVFEVNVLRTAER